MERIFDVHLELDPLKLAGQSDPTRMIAELSRHQADEVCAQSGLTLRYPDPREVVVSQGLEPLTGRNVTLVATRWVADSA